MAREKKSEMQEARRNRIEAAAFEVLEDMGYRKASMLQIAKRAQASNETLYNWYGSKQALFSSIIEDNSKVLKQVLADAIAGANDPDPASSVEAVARLLLQFTATEKAIIINRAAVSDVAESGLLAATIETHARQAVSKLLVQFMQRLEKAGRFDFGGNAEEATGVFVSLVMGELQIQQALGALQPLSDAEIDRRAASATQHFRRIFAGAQSPGKAG